MRYFSLSVLAASVVMGAPAIAQTDQVKRGPVPAWVTPSELLPVPDNASGSVFLRRQDVLIHLDGEGQAQHLAYRIRILHPNALQVGNLSVAWNPAAGAPMVHAIITYNTAIRDAAVGNGKAVPATYEIDWTGNDVPCGVGSK